MCTFIGETKQVFKANTLNIHSNYYNPNLTTIQQNPSSTFIGQNRDSIPHSNLLNRVNVKSNTRIPRALTFVIITYLKITYDFQLPHHTQDYTPSEFTSIPLGKVFGTQVQESQTKRIYNSGRTLPSANQQGLRFLPDVHIYLPQVPG